MEEILEVFVCYKASLETIEQLLDNKMMVLPESETVSDAARDLALAGKSKFTREVFNGVLESVKAYDEQLSLLRKLSTRALKLLNKLHEGQLDTKPSKALDELVEHKLVLSGELTGCLVTPKGSALIATMIRDGGYSAVFYD